MNARTGRVRRNASPSNLCPRRRPATIADSQSAETPKAENSILGAWNLGRVSYSRCPHGTHVCPLVACRFLRGDRQTGGNWRRGAFRNMPFNELRYAIQRIPYSNSTFPDAGFPDRQTDRNSPWIAQLASRRSSYSSGDGRSLCILRLIWGLTVPECPPYAPLRRRYQPKPIPQRVSRVQMARVEGSGTTDSPTIVAVNVVLSDRILCHPSVYREVHSVAWGDIDVDRVIDAHAICARDELAIYMHTVEQDTSSCTVPPCRIELRQNTGNRGGTREVTFPAPNGEMFHRSATT